MSLTATRRPRELMALSVDALAVCQEQLLDSSVTVNIEGPVDVSTFVFVAEPTVDNMVAAYLPGVTPFK